jgi:hypothetical protein
VSAPVDVLADCACSQCGGTLAMDWELSSCRFCVISGIVKSARSFHRLAQVFKRQYGPAASNVAHCRNEATRRMRNVRLMKRAALARVGGAL